MKSLVLALGALAILANPALAENEPYLESGRRTAEANCVQCHHIWPGGAFKLYPPSFAAIAKYYSPDVIEMKIMYPEHALLMPQFHTFMFSENLTNLVGYIASLEE